MEIKFSGLNFNPDDNSHKIKKEESNNSKYSHEINYAKSNHPMDVIGRSLVSFSGAKQKPSIEDVIKYVTENEILTDDREVEELKQSLSEKENTEAALECAKLYKDNPNVNRFCASILISNARKEGNCLLEKIFTNERANEIIVHHCGNLMNKLEFVNDETMDFFCDLYTNPNIGSYFASSIVNSISTGGRAIDYHKEEMANARAKCKMYEQIKKAEGGTLTFEDDPNLEKKRVLLCSINHKNEDFMLKFMGNDCKLNLEEGELWTLIRICNNINETNMDLASLLIEDDSFDKRYTEQIICNTNGKKPDKEDMDAKKAIYLEFKDNKNIKKDKLASIITKANKSNAEVIKRALSSEVLLKKGIIDYLDTLNVENLDFITDLFTNEEYKDVQISQNSLENILENLKTGGSKFAKKLIKDKIIPENKISNALRINPMIEKERYIAVYEAKDRFYEKYKNNENYEGGKLAEIIENINDINEKLADDLISTNSFSAYDIQHKLSPTSKDINVEKRIIEVKRQLLMQAVTEDGEIDDLRFLGSIDETNLNFLNILLSDKTFPHSKLNEAISANGTQEERAKIYNLRYKLYLKLKEEKDLSIEDVANVISKINLDNYDLAIALLEDKNFPNNLIYKPLTCYSYRNTKEIFAAKKELYEELKDSKEIKKEDLAELLEYVNEGNGKFAKELAKDQAFPNKKISAVIRGADFDEIWVKSNFYDKFKSNDIEENLILADILSSIEPKNAKFAEELYTSGSFPKSSIANAIELNIGGSEKEDAIEARKELFEKYKDQKDASKTKLAITLKSVKGSNKEFAEMLITDPIVEPLFCEKALLFAGYDSEEEKRAIQTRMSLHQKYKNAPENVRIPLIQSYSLIDEVNADFTEKLLTLGGNDIISFLNAVQYLGLFSCGAEGLRAKEACFEKVKACEELDANDKLEFLGSIDQTNIEFANELLDDKDFPKKNIQNIISRNIFNMSDKDIIETKQEFYKTHKNNKLLGKENLSNILTALTSTNIDFAKELMADKNYPKEKVASSIFTILPSMTELLDAKVELYNKYKNNPDIKKENLAAAISAIEDESLKEDAEKILLKADKMELTPCAIESMISKAIDYRDYRKLVRAMGKNEVEKLSIKDLGIACSCAHAYKIENINELSQVGKKNLLRSLINTNIDLFDQSDIIKKSFPLLPKNQEEYCELLPGLVRSLGIETNTLSESETKKFEADVLDLGQKLASISDEEYANLEITQEYSKEEFTKDVLNKLKGLNKTEKQKVYDYFGFELHKNKINETGYTITGYPQNLNNGAKLAQITDPKTKEVVEQLRKDVIRFTENNKINCSNKEIEETLNKVVEVMPELRPLIGRSQAGMNGTQGAHEFDILKHSLKVMQKITCQKAFNDLSQSDKKVMMLASLLHDITKKEGFKDPTHPKEGSFDAFYISKKFNLTKDEEIKLYTIIKNHEWLGYVNTSQDKDELKKRLQSVAYDLRHDNLFDLSLMFTHADLKAIKKDDSFHDKKEGKARVGTDGIIRSFGEAADFYAGKDTDTVKSNTVKGYINELKKSQPVLPVTKIPNSSRINEAITQINKDGSTNLKGIYKDNDLVIIKFNEVEDETWEKIGFKKGSTTKGIKAIAREKEDNEIIEYEVETGNIKFMCHGLNYPNQLARFDAFAMPDSDALLSVSYAERPETKYRMFRPQGVILDTDTKYIHGGGKTDAGSGCGKSINEFKKSYIFGGEREKDRLYISKLIKKATGMTDSEYVKFVKENENKSLSEIEPKELQEIIIKAYAGIPSTVKTGKRNYNEMYITNPKPPMAVFAYNIDYTECINNPVEFLNRETINGYEKNYGDEKPVSVKERTQFLKDYAKEHNIPFIVFGE